MLTQFVMGLNGLSNRLGSILLAPIAWLPGPIASTLIAVATGAAMLLVFKYTSNQAAIKKTRDRIRANLLALSLFKEDLFVGFRAQGRLIGYAAKLIGLSLVPMLVMIVPMSLLLSQLALWYQARPLRVGEEALVTVVCRANDSRALTELRFLESPAVQSMAGPVRVPSQQAVYWRIQAKQPGQHVIQFGLGEEHFHKELAVSDGFLPVSLQRPARHWEDVLFHPRESPFATTSQVQSIEVQYPDRHAWTTGTKTWLLYWFGLSMLAALIVRPWFHVNL